jgi:hypothetical protein
VALDSAAAACAIFLTARTLPFFTALFTLALTTAFFTFAGAISVLVVPAGRCH